MHAWLEQLAADFPWYALILSIAAIIAVLGKAADMLVDEAVVISTRLKVPTIIIGATLVSVGTTIPEAVVSVLSALQGNPGLALGNAVGSVICDTGLILGTAILIGLVPVPKDIVSRQGNVQLLCGIGLVLVAIPWLSLSQTFIKGSHIPQPVGWFFLCLLAIYIWQSIRWGQQSMAGISSAEDELPPVFVQLLKLSVAIALVVVSSDSLIVFATELARRLAVPEAVIAATLVAFGTSLPELVTAISAVRKGQGALALGNVIGADILNVLFVVGAATAVSKNGLYVDPHFFKTLFPAMILILSVFRIGAYSAKTHLQKPFGALLIAVYLFVLVISYG